MNKKILGMQIAGAIVTIAFAVLPAFAATAGAIGSVDITGNPVPATSNTTLLDARATGHGDDQINLRIASLTDLNTRIQTMTKVSAADKSGLQSMVESQITGLDNLKAKIDADTDVAAVRADDLTITKDFRIYLLVLPQGRIEAASDRALQIGDSFATLSAKLNAEISSAQTAGNSVTGLNTKLADLNTQVSASNDKANAAISQVAGLAPDNGNTSIAASNEVALNSAKVDIQDANADLKIAYADAKAIVAGLKAVHIDTSAAITVSPTATQ